MVKPTLVSIVAVDGRNETTLLALAAGAARGLESPFSIAIQASADERDVEVAPVDRIHEAGAAGVVASIGGRTVVVGTAALFTSLGLSIDGLGNCPERLQQRGQHVLFVAVDGRTAGFMGVIDAGAEGASGRRV